METRTSEEMLVAIVALSERVPTAPVGSACLGLAEILADFHGQLPPDAVARLATLGGMLWRRGQELGDLVTEDDLTEGSPN